MAKASRFLFFDEMLLVRRGGTASTPGITINLPASLGIALLMDAPDVALSAGITVPTGVIVYLSAFAPGFTLPSATGIQPPIGIGNVGHTSIH